jgi:hypothetical protein
LQLADHRQEGCPRDDEVLTGRQPEQTIATAIVGFNRERQRHAIAPLRFASPTSARHGFAVGVTHGPRDGGAAREQQADPVNRCPSCTTRGTPTRPGADAPYAIVT